jgi:hypothetical protein
VSTTGTEPSKAVPVFQLLLQPSRLTRWRYLHRPSHSSELHRYWERPDAENAPETYLGDSEAGELLLPLTLGAPWPAPPT